MYKWIIGAALALASLGVADHHMVRPRSSQPRAPRSYSRQPF